MPTIGCAKSRLIGSHREVGMKKGSHCRLMDDKEVIGRVLRTREGLKCMYISEGHRIILDEAVQIVLKCCRGYRLPEPTRRAHQLATKIRKQVL
ncbi:MAG: endonuclease V [Sedimentisphaerales bacterium]|nr:endonuclease V [Sedimentisphaerales bacterium]